MSNSKRKWEQLTEAQKVLIVKEYDAIPVNSKGTAKESGILALLARKWRVSKDTIMLLVKKRNLHA